MSLNYQAQYNQEIRQWLIKVFEVAASISKDSLAQRNCPVCYSPNNVFYANNNYLDYVKCIGCGLIYMNPAPTPDMVARGFSGEDKVLIEYFQIISKYKTTVPERTDPTKDDKLRDIFAYKRSGRLLDVGCSVGDFLHKAKYHYEVEGLEVNPHTAKIAEMHFKIHKQFVANLEMSGDLDIVTLNQILYGISDPVGLLKDIRKVLKDDGILYINTPNSDSFAMELFRGRVNHLYGYTTLNVFNNFSLEVLARKAGFRILSIRTEWLDIYLTDIYEYLSNPDQFIHKRNSHIPGYEEKISAEDALLKSFDLDLKKRGNYIVAVLGKI